MCVCEIWGKDDFISGLTNSSGSAAPGTARGVMSCSCCPATSVVLSALITLTKAESAFIAGLWEENVLPVSILVSFL